MGRLRAFSLVLAGLCAWVVGSAGGALAMGLDALAWPGSGITLARLGQAVFSGATLDEDSGALTTGPEKLLRQPGTRERATLPEGTPVREAEAFTVRGDGRRYLVTLFTAAASVGHPGESSVILALFPEGASEPTDVVSVQTDVFCDHGEGRTLVLGPDDAFFLRNHHNNSNQSYLDTGLFHVVEGRLRRIAAVFTLEVRSDCAHTFFEFLSWRVEPVAGAAYPQVVATVRLAPDTACKGARTGVRPRTFTETYRWNAGQKRFLPLGKGFDALDALHAKSL